MYYSLQISVIYYQHLTISGEDCKKKFKYLKDEYRKAQQKIPQPAPGAPAEKHVPNFKYFKMMRFLRGDSSTTGKNSVEHLFDDTDTSFSETDAINPQTTQNNNKRQCSKRTTNIEDKYLEKRIKLLETDIERFGKEDSDDLLFFKSLLPYVENISHLKKLEFRAQLINIIINIKREEEVDNNKYN